MSIEHIDIGEQYSRVLGPRYRRDGQFSGEDFRDSVLEPAFLRADKLVVHLDSLSGYSASFLEEAFGGLVRKYGLDLVENKIVFDTIRRQYLVPKIRAWMREAAEQPAAER